jgi:hypothetical protein
VGRQHDLVPASIRHAAVTTAIVLGAPVFIAALAVAGVTIPDDLRSPLINAGLLTRDANEALEADGGAQPRAVAPTAGAQRTVAERVSRNDLQEPGSRASQAAGTGRQAARRDAGSETTAPAGAGAPVVAPEHAGAPAEETAGPVQPDGDAAPGGVEGGPEAGAPAAPAVPSPVQQGLSEVDQSVNQQLGDAVDAAPIGQSAAFGQLGGDED